VNADEVVRHEAAGRLRAAAAHLPYGEGLEALADRIAIGEPNAASWLTAAARALLTPVSQPATGP